MPLRNFRERLSKLLDQTRDSAQQNIPAEQVRNQLPSRTLPPATGTSKGGVTLSDSTPASVGTAAPGTAADVSRHDHVHAHGNQAGGSLHPAATTSVAGFLSAADKTLLDALPVPQYLTLALTGTLTNERRVVAGTGITLTDGGAGGDLTIAASAAGTVTSVALTAPAEISVAGSPITGAGTLALTWANATANRVFAGPTTGSPATPAFRALVSGDIPDLSATYQPLDADLTAIAALSSTGLAVRTGTDTWAQRSIAGTASRIAVTNGNGVSGNPTLDIDAAYVGQASLTTLGTIGTGVWQGTKVGLAYGGTNADLSATGGSGQYLKQSSAGAAITVGAIPYTDLTYSGLTNGQVWRATGSGTADFGRIDFSLSVAFTGQLLTIYGGTGIASYTTGDLIYASGSTTLSKLADVATGNALISGGVGVAPSWGKVDLTAHVTGVLPSANGGTGVNNAGTLTNASNTTITGGGTLALAGFTLTASATGTAALRASSATAGRVGFWSDANSLSHDTNFFFNTTSKYLIVGDSTVTPISGSPKLVLVGPSTDTGLELSGSTTSTSAGIANYNFVNRSADAGKERIAAIQVLTDTSKNRGRMIMYLRRASDDALTAVLTLRDDEAAALSAWLELVEITAPAAGAANTGRLYLEDNGAGKTRLMIKFNTGAAQQIAIQP